jgi:hypothetical protein
MIINSNLCHIYRSMMGVNNNNVSNSTSTSTTETSYQACLNNLLSTIMVVVDRNKIVCNENNATDDDDYDCEYDEENVDDDDNDNDNDQEEEEPSPSTRKRRREHNSIVALDGFLHNASPLFLQDQCADIA